MCSFLYLFEQAMRKDSRAPPKRPQRAKMAAPVADAGEFESWLNDRLDSLEVDREVYGAYILGVLQEEESDEEKEEVLQGILSAFLVNIQSGMSRSVTEAVRSHVLLSVLSAGRCQVTALGSAVIYGAKYRRRL